MTTAVRLTHLNRCIIVIVLLNSTHGEKPVQVPTETTGSQNCSSAGLAANQQNAKANTTQYVWIILMLVLPAAEPDRSERETHCAVLEAGRYVSRERTFWVRRSSDPSPSKSSTVQLRSTAPTWCPQVCKDHQDRQEGLVHHFTIHSHVAH